MNWTTFQTHNQAPEKSFETLCNQLFENWCSSEYGSDILSFNVVNGSGGDGGVESYATLRNGNIIGLQAKWFPNSISSSQINQIKSSIQTALTIRPNITIYIVCIPRDLSSTTGKSQNNESKRWKKLINSIYTNYPNLKIILWNETRLFSELQKNSSSGILKYWFSNSEISEETFEFAFKRSKESWLKTKYVPDLNTQGKISSSISFCLGDYSTRESLSNSNNYAMGLCIKFVDTATQLTQLIKSEDPCLTNKLNNVITKINLLIDTCKSICKWTKEESSSYLPIDINICKIDFNGLIRDIKLSSCSYDHYFHVADVTNALGKLSSFDFHSLINNFNSSLNHNPILFIGDPGTGKTHGVAAFTEKLFHENLHMSLLIQAKNIPQSYSWKDIIISALNLSTNWNEDEILQALVSMVNRNKFSTKKINCDIKIIPKVLIIVDAIDESLPYTKWKERIQEASVISDRYPQIRFCFTSRPHVFSTNIDNIKSIHINSSGDVPVYKLFDSYIKAYNITVENNCWLKYALTTPLSLKLFCELNQNKIVKYANNTDVSLTELLRSKIQLIEDEYCEREDESNENQYILKAINSISNKFLDNSQIERTHLIESIATSINISKEKSEKIISYIESYGILSSLCENGEGLNPNKYFYFPGIQGYFDYATAIILLEKHAHPKNIDFNEYTSIESNSIYILSIISIQKFDYLITQNPTISSVIDTWEIFDLQLFSLRHSTPDNGKLYKNSLIDLMSKGANNLIRITNKLILPISRDIKHPLGIPLLDEFLLSFKKPAERDLFWSVPEYLGPYIEFKWHLTEPINLNDEFALTADDVYNGIPSVYVWALSNLNNIKRKQYRNSLMKWAKKAPYEFYNLFIKYSNINDPQILSDLFSILVCLVYDGANTTFIKLAADFMLENILHPKIINKNTDISIRYYAIAIVKKGILTGLYDEQSISKYMPPYFSQNSNLPFSAKALKGTRLSGYSAINYDLARYVLIDPLESAFTCFGQSEKDQLNELLSKLVSDRPSFQGKNNEQLIISAAYAYILQMGWNEDEFYNIKKSDISNEKSGGLDIAINKRHYHATYGNQSNIMTVCEKYIWQFRNHFYGFLADRLMYFNNTRIPEYITDYSLLDNFKIPLQEIEQIDQYNCEKNRPWHIPEKDVAILDGYVNNHMQVIDNVLKAPSFDWEKWITIDNTENKYNVNSNILLALNSHSYFYGAAGVETSIIINSLLINKNKVQEFIFQIQNDKDLSDSIADPDGWSGGIDSSCYITPKEVCWFPWKKRYDSENADMFPQIELQSAVDECYYNFPEYGDVHYTLPSKFIREILDIVNSNGYVYLDTENNIKAVCNEAGENHYTFQKYLLVGKYELLSKLHKKNKEIIWITREYRRESCRAREKFGNFHAEKDNYYLCYFDNDQLVVKNILSKNDIW